jgi:RNA-directed DNA polymerase
MSTKLSRITELAKENKERRFLSIAHYLTVEALFEAYTSLRTDASAGVDGVTVAEYEENVWERLQQLHDRIKSGRYRARPLRRVYVPKEDGRQRPISIPTVSAYCTSYNDP